VKIRGDILLGKVYGYSDRFGDLTEVLLSNTFTVVPSLRYGVAQKNNADIHLVIDALEVAYTNPLIDSFCIVSGDSDYNPLVGKLKSMGKFVLGISRSEVASTIFINSCNEFQFLESVGSKTARKKKNASSDSEPMDDSDLNKLIETIFTEQADEEEMYASELKDILMRLQPDFNEKAYGCATFGKLLAKLEKKFGTLHLTNNNFNLMVSLQTREPSNHPQITRENYRDAFKEQLRHYKEDGFDRINPSILKGDIQAAFPDFTEKSIGFKRFSDVLKALEKDGLLVVEMDEQKTMLIKVV